MGTGTARIPIGIAENEPDCKVYAIDLSLTMLKFAQENIQENIKNKGLEDKITFLLADAKLLPFKDNSFDLVLCSNLLHHLDDPTLVLNEMNRVAKKTEGEVFIRDLIRPPRWIAKLCVRIFGMFYDEAIKKDYWNSLCAAFSLKEFKQLVGNWANIAINFPHYVTIVRKKGLESTDTKD